MRTNILRHVALALGISTCAFAQAGDYTSPAKWSNFSGNQSQSLYRMVGTETNLVESPSDAPAMQNAAAQHGHAATAEVPSHAPNGDPIISSTCGPCQGAPIVHESPYASAAQAPWTGSTVVTAPPVTTQHSVLYGAAPAIGSTCSNGSCGHTHVHRGAASHIAGKMNRLGGCMGGGGNCGISPWFGGFNLLFLDLEENKNRNILVDDAFGNKALGFEELNPSDSVAIEFNVGRYIQNGCYGLDFSYFLFNPDMVEQIITPPSAGDYRSAMPQWNGLNLDPGTGVDTVYNHMDGATAYRARRDLRFNGFQANLVSFGAMGARRIGAAGCNGVGSGLGVGRHLGLNQNCRRYGGAGGFQTNPCGRVQVRTSYGVRWFQMEDEFELAADINGAGGYQADDVYYNVDVENNLIGFQFGSVLTYCLSPRMLLNVGGRIGIYGNDVEVRQRLGTETTLAYITTSGVDDYQTEASDTVFSVLGELDLGLGYRLSNAWTLTGGYRLITASGVATAPGSISDDFSSLASAAYIDADDSFILHGGYVGLQYNW